MKIKISIFTILFFILAYYLKMLKPLIFIFMIMTLHEMQHVIAAKIFHYKVSQITFYPFGLAATIDDLGLGQIKQEIIIILAGLCTHAWIPFLFMGLQSLDLISFAFFEWLLAINFSILLFNCLPVFPLDGGRLIQALIHCWFPFYQAEQFTCVLSLIIWGGLLLNGLMNNLMGFFVIVFLLLQLFVCIKNIYYRQRRFWLYRQSHLHRGKLKVHQKRDLYRNKTNIIAYNHQLLTEMEWLAMQFHENPQQTLQKGKQIMI